MSQFQLSEVAQGWNARASKTIHQFPPELLEYCFAHLGFQERRVIMHVCRAWYRAMVSAPSLWTECTATIDATQDMGLVLLHLRYSLRLPLDLCLHAQTIYQQTLAYRIIEHLDHIRSLTLHFSCPELINLKKASAPLLTYINIYHGMITLPMAPLLRTVVARNVLFDKLDFYFKNLVSFTGDLEGRGAADFFLMCPNLEHLDGGRPFYERQPRPRVSDRLAELRLVDWSADCNDYLREFHGCTLLRKVQLRGPYTSRNLFEFFESGGRQLYWLELSRAHVVMKCDPISDFYLHVWRDGRMWAWNEIAGSLLTLCHLVIQCEAPTDGHFLHLPALESLTLEVTAASLGTHDVVYSAPTLQSLTVIVYKGHRISHNFTAELSDVVQCLPTFSHQNLKNSRLEKLVLSRLRNAYRYLNYYYDEASEPNIWDVVEFTALQSCANRVFYEEHELDLSRTPEC